MVWSGGTIGGVAAGASGRVNSSGVSIGTSGVGSRCRVATGFQTGPAVLDAAGIASGTAISGTAATATKGTGGTGGTGGTVTVAGVFCRGSALNAAGSGRS